MKEYPKHCIDCRNKEKCQQKYHMLADTEPVIGYANFDAADLVCENCLDIQDHFQVLDNPEVDSPIHCAICGIPLECQLTTDGIDYVKETIEAEDDCCRELWPVLFAGALE